MRSNRQKIESRAEKCGVIHVLFGWLASFYAIRRAFLQHISERVSVESVKLIIKREFLPLRMKDG